MGTRVTLPRWAWLVGNGLACVAVLAGCKRPTLPVPSHETLAQKLANPGAKPSAPAAEAPQAPGHSRVTSEPSSVRVGGVNLKLEACVLTFSSSRANGRFDVGFPSPCRFADDGRGAVQTVAVRGGTVVLVESSQALPPIDSGVRDCDTRLRGVLVRGQRVFISQSTQKVASCGPGPWDSIMFHVFADRTVPIGP